MMNASSASNARFIVLFAMPPPPVICAASPSSGLVLTRTRSGVGYLDLLPGLVRIERRHAFRYGFGAIAEILLIDRSVMIDDERHDTRVAVLGGIGHQGEASNHL